MGNISGVTIPPSKDNIINSATNSTDNNSYNSNLSDAYDFYYESEDMYIPETQEEINENNTNLQDEITNLTNTNNELETEKKRIETLKKNFDYDEELRTKYELNEDAAGRIMNPSEYEKIERSDGYLDYLNPDGLFNEELFQERIADYTDRYNKALNESTNGEFTDIDILSERMSELNLNIASNNESNRLKTKEQQEAEYDNKALTDCFKDNMNNETNYKDKMTESEQGYEYCKDIVLSMNNLGNQNDAENHFKELTGKELCAYDLLECLAEEKYGISSEQLRAMTAEEAEEFIRNLQGDGYNWADQAYGTYKYLNDKQLAMIKTIAEEDGLFESRKYYECIEEKITSLQGMEDAIGFFNDLLKDSGYDIDDVRILVNQEGEFVVYTLNENGEYVENYELSTNVQNVLRSFGEGVEDGVVGFFDGIANVLNDSSNRTRIDYKKLYIAYFLSNNVILKGSYDVGNGVGNLLPSIAVNALIGFAGVPAALQSNLGYIMLGISAYGGAKHEYEVKGMTGSKVIVGAIFKGLLEYLTGRMFGRIPWLNEEATLALSEYMKTGSNIFTSLEWGKLLGAIADNMVHEGMEEFIQSYFESGIDCAVTGEKYEIKETTKEALYSFLIGALTSGVLSGSNVAIDFTFNGIEYKMNQQEIEDFLSKVESTKEITALNIFTTMKKYNCSTDLAQIILDKNLNEEQASALVEIYNNDPSIDVEDILPSIILEILKLQKIAMKEGMTLKEYGNQTSNTQEDPEIKATADALAALKHAEAELAEPQISEDMKSLEKDGVQLASYDKKIKKEGSISRKIISDYKEQSKNNPNLTLQEVSDKIGDSIRYTLVCDSETYTQDVKDCMAELLKKGYKIRKFKNNFDNPNYKGINVGLIAPDGSLVELQFHTEQSYKYKENIGHLVYEIARNEYVSPEAKQIANRLRKQIASEIEIPEGVSELTKENIERINLPLDDIFIEEIKNVKSITEVPEGFDSIEAYKRNYIDELLNKYNIDLYSDSIIKELCKDPIMLEELLRKTDKVENIIIDNYQNNRNKENNIILNNLSLENAQVLLSKPKMKDYINRMSPKKLSSFIGNLMKIYGTETNLNSTIIDKICTFNIDELIEFGNDFILQHTFDQTLFSGEETDQQSLDNIKKLNDYLMNNIYTEENLRNILDLNDIILFNIVPGIAYGLENQDIRQMINDIKLQEKELKEKIFQKIEKASNVELTEHNYYGLIYPAKASNYLDIVIEANGKEYKYTKLIFSDYLEIDNLILKTPELKEALFNDTLNIKSIEVNNSLSSMVLTEQDGLKKGINYVKYSVDGIEIEDIIDFNSIVDLTYKYPGAKELKVLNIEYVGDFDIKVPRENESSFYEIKYKINGEERTGYTTPRIDYNGNLIVSVSDFLRNNKLFGATDIEVSQVERPEIDMSSIKDLSSFNEIFSETVFGGNQSDVENLVLDYVLNPVEPTTVEQKKAQQLVNMIKNTFPNATEMEIINIADTYSSHGCFYMAIANAFAAYIGNMENGETLFKDRMGFDLKTTANGETSYNLEAIALDIFLRTAKNVTNGDISRIKETPGVSIGEIQTIIVDYFAEKGVKVDYNVSWNHYSANKYSALLSQILSNPEKIHILIGDKFDLDLYDNKGSLNNADNALDTANINGKHINNIGAHAMIITSANDKEIQVSTWGKPAKLADSNFGLGNNSRLDIGSFRFEVQ